MTDDQSRPAGWAAEQDAKLIRLRARGEALQGTDDPWEAAVAEPWREPPDPTCNACESGAHRECSGRAGDAPCRCFAGGHQDY